MIALDPWWDNAEDPAGRPLTEIATADSDNVGVCGWCRDAIHLGEMFGADMDGELVCRRCFW